MSQQLILVLLLLAWFVCALLDISLAQNVQTCQANFPSRQNYILNQKNISLQVVLLTLRNVIFI